MNVGRRTRRASRAVAAIGIMLCSNSADAHLMSSGMGPIYDGLLHFLTSPEDLLPVLGLSLLVGLRGTAYGRRAMFTLPGAWLLGCLLGLSTAATTVLEMAWPRDGRADI